jgi:hypothetical protein
MASSASTTLTACDAEGMASSASTACDADADGV